MSLVVACKSVLTCSVCTATRCRSSVQISVRAVVLSLLNADNSLLKESILLAPST